MNRSYLVELQLLLMIVASLSPSLHVWRTCLPAEHGTLKSQTSDKHYPTTTKTSVYYQRSSHTKNKTAPY